MAIIAPLIAVGSAALSTAAPVLGAASALLSGVGMLQQGVATKQAAEFNQQVSNIQAKQAADEAAFKAGQIARQTDQKLATARAGVLQNGLELEGSPTDLLTAIRDTGTMDYMTAVYEGGSRAAGYKNDALLSGMKAGYAMPAAMLGAGARVFGGLADVYKGSGSLKGAGNLDV